MSLVLNDRVLETCTSPGTGSVTLLGAATGFRTFSAGVGNGNTCYYTIADQNGGNWEVGLGTYTSSSNSLARTTVLSSSNSGSLVNFNSGTQNVFVTYPAEKSVYLDASGNLTLSGSITLSGGTANGVLYLNGSDVISSGTALSFDGTNFSTTGNATAAALIPSGATVPTNGMYLPAANTVAWSTSSSEGMRLTSAGFLGIGTSSPSVMLNVVYGGDVARFQNTGNGSVNVYWKNSVQQYSYRLDPNNNGSRDYSIYDDTNGQFVDSYFQGSSGYRAFFTNGAERMRLDSSGNLGLGVTPSGWGAGFAPIQSSYGILSGNNQATMLANAYYNGGYKYITSNYAAQYLLSGTGQHQWFIAGSGTAGNAISFTQAMTLDASGNLGIGTTSTAAEFSGYTALKVSGASGATVSLSTGSTVRSQIVGDFNNTYISQFGPGGIIFGVQSAAFSGSTATERARIDSSGNFGIGTASPNASAILDVQSTTKGVRFPNMTTTQKNAISSPAAGLVVFDTTLAKLCVYSGAAWQTITSI